MKVGFTGTRSGMTDYQKALIKKELESAWANHPDLMVIHGDCIGADADFDEIAMNLGIPREIFPCHLSSMRAWRNKYGAICTREPIAPLKRNERIVEAVDILIAAPYSSEEQVRSGTWHTIRYARKIKKQHLIFWPSDTTPAT
jgi:hypothetical protein